MNYTIPEKTYIIHTFEGEIKNACRLPYLKSNAV